MGTYWENLPRLPDFGGRCVLVPDQTSLNPVRTCQNVSCSSIGDGNIPKAMSWVGILFAAVLQPQAVYQDKVIEEKMPAFGPFGPLQIRAWGLQIQTALPICSGRQSGFRHPSGARGHWIGPMHHL